ncbi:hypothetical protein F5148DRAFT_687094 [Russula earlei]|uniref:Uncharacterized protein n=1 Tax=Russula earlei TaxID=71964 RepID=A0ACC0UFK5_9AGAM|nr:hypothetical protein F5148DRAFT_687094 [Russula earlei]
MRCSTTKPRKRYCGIHFFFLFFFFGFPGDDSRLLHDQWRRAQSVFHSGVGKRTIYGTHECSLRILNPTHDSPAHSSVVAPVVISSRVDHTLAQLSTVYHYDDPPFRIELDTRRSSHPQTYCTTVFASSLTNVEAREPSTWLSPLSIETITVSGRRTERHARLQRLLSAEAHGRPHGSYKRRSGPNEILCQNISKFERTNNERTSLGCCWNGLDQTTWLHGEGNECGGQTRLHIEASIRAKLSRIRATRKDCD